MISQLVEALQLATDDNCNLAGLLCAFITVGGCWSNTDDGVARLLRWDAHCHGDVGVAGKLTKCFSEDHGVSVLAILPTMILLTVMLE